MRSSKTPLRVALGSLAVFGAGFVLIGLSGWGPPASNEQTIGEISRWCERVSASLLREPINTLGNLGFVIVGILMFLTLAHDVDRSVPRVNRFIGNDRIALLYAAAAVFLGPGSMVMHGTHTRFGAWIDNLSMVAYILIPWLFNLSQAGRWRDRTFFLTYATLLTIYGIGFWYFGPDLGIGLDLFGVSIGLWVISEVLYRWWSPWMRRVSFVVGFVVAAVFGVTPRVMLANPAEHWWVLSFFVPGILAPQPAPGRRIYTPWFWVGIASFLTAYRIWLTGTDTSPSCDPDSLLQAHAVWHVLCAVAIYSFFRFFRTERSLELQPVLAEADGRRA